MPVDFFAAPCDRQNGNCRLPGIVCKCTTQNREFGICDDTEPEKEEEPAYIKFHTPDTWIAEIENPQETSVTFKAIDKCVQLYRPNGEPAQRCDGILYTDTSLYFVELKDRTKDGWLSEGREQLTDTIRHFIRHHHIQEFATVKAHICNRQRPLAQQSTNTEVQKFKDETAELLNTQGLLLNTSRRISF